MAHDGDESLNQSETSFRAEASSESHKVSSPLAQPTLHEISIPEGYHQHLINFLLVNEVFAHAILILHNESLKLFPIFKKDFDSSVNLQGLFVLSRLFLLVIGYVTDSFVGVLVMIRGTLLVTFLTTLTAFVATFQSSFTRDEVAVVHLILFFLSQGWLPVRIALMVQQFEGGRVGARRLLVWGIVASELGEVLACGISHLQKSEGIIAKRLALVCFALYLMVHYCVIEKAQRQGKLKHHFKAFCIDKTMVFLLHNLLAKLCRSLRIKLSIPCRFSKETEQDGKKIIRFGTILLLCIPVVFMIEFTGTLVGKDLLFMDCLFQKFPNSCYLGAYGAITMVLVEFLIFTPLANRGKQMGTHFMLIFGYICAILTLILSTIQSTDINKLLAVFGEPGDSQVMVFSGLPTETTVYTQMSSEPIELQPFCFRNFINSVNSKISLQFFNSHSGFHFRKTFELKAPVSYIYMLTLEGIRSLTPSQDVSCFNKKGQVKAQLRILDAFELETGGVLKLIHITDQSQPMVNVKLNQSSISKNYEISKGIYVPKLLIKGKRFTLRPVELRINGRYFFILHSLLTPQYTFIDLLRKSEIDCWTAYMIIIIHQPTLLIISLYVFLLVYEGSPKSHLTFLYALFFYCVQLGKTIGFKATISPPESMTAYMYSLAALSVLLIATVYFILRKELKKISHNESSRK